MASRSSCHGVGGRTGASSQSRKSAYRPRLAHCGHSSAWHKAAMRKLIVCFLASALCGCLSSSNYPTGTLVSDYSDVAAHDGNQVTVVGYLSRTHEATGLYFSLADLDNENDRCIMPQPLPEARHGARVSISGILSRTRCGGELICTNTCDNYELRSAPPE